MAGPSVIVVQGLPGAGKTALVTKAVLTTRRRRGGDLRWFDCPVSRDLDLGSIVATLVVQDPGSAAGRELRAALARQADADPSRLAQVVMDYLTAQRTVLVIDNFHNVEDEGIGELIRCAERSIMPSTLLLITRRRVDALHAYPGVARHSIEGLEAHITPEFLKKWGVDTGEDVARRVWEATAGLPQAILVLAGWKRRELTLHGLSDIPLRTDDLRSWIEPLYRGLADREKELAKLIAFLRAPAETSLIRAADTDTGPETTGEVLHSLCGRLIVTESGGTYRMHSLMMDFVAVQTTDAERDAFGPRVAAHFQARARELLLGVDEHPSYGRLYLEAHSEYVRDAAGHERLVDDLMARLAELSLRPAPGARILVLGSGNGIHDAGFAKYGVKITNLDIQPEIVELGRSAATDLDAEIEYVVGDMTRPLDRPENSMDAVFCIGSSFGYEGDDADNAAIFRHAARILKPGRPFVFEYVNGGSWYERDPVTSETLPSGAVRTKYRIADRAARTSLDVISLRWPGEVEPEWFHHFMHYYTIETVERMMRDTGLAVARSYGATGGRVTGEPFDDESSDAMVIIALNS